MTEKSMGVGSLDSAFLLNAHHELKTAKQYAENYSKKRADCCKILRDSFKPLVDIGQMIFGGLRVFVQINF